MKIVFAQGNPDLKYKNTRHNTGFLILDALGEKYDAQWKNMDKYRGLIAVVIVNGEKTILVKPLSYYNDTGLVARQLVGYYKLTPEDDFLVVHDDLALPLGTIRVRTEGSDAGNNGIKSLNQHLGDHYSRLRIGIWSELRDRMDDVNFVLGNFSKDEQEKLEKDIMPASLHFIEAFIAGSLAVTSQKV